MRVYADPRFLPRSGETPEQVLARALRPEGNEGERYLLRRGVPAAVASAAGVRFAPDFAGRAAVVAPLCGRHGELKALHGRYLHATSREGKMLTFGAVGGVFTVLDGWRCDPFIMVEGLFDALSLAVCGYPCLATIGRWGAWLPQVASGREVWLAFDAGRPGEGTAALFRKRLEGARVHRLLPPPRCKDWNTALVKGGRERVARWIARELAAPEEKG